MIAGVMCIFFGTMCIIVHCIFLYGEMCDSLLIHDFPCDVRNQPKRVSLSEKLVSPSLADLRTRLEDAVVRWDADGEVRIIRPGRRTSLTP
jgi:hypothetical protein